MINETKTSPTPVPSEQEFRINPIITLEEMKIRYVQWVLARFGGNKKAAGDALGLSRQSVHNILKAAGEK